MEKKHIIPQGQVHSAVAFDKSMFFCASGLESKLKKLTQVQTTIQESTESRLFKQQ